MVAIDAGEPPEEEALTALDWLALLHPALMILFVYPVVGATIRLGILVRERRLDLNPIAATVPVEHVDHGRWVTTAMVVGVLVALAANLARGIASGSLSGQGDAMAIDGHALAAAAALGAVALGSILALWRGTRTGLRML